MARMTGMLMTLALLAGLGGCATPLQQCLYDAEQTSRDLERELSERYANLSRGYSIERVIVPEMVPSMCPGAGGVPVPCMRWEQTTDEIHHRIDRELERERVALLEHQLERERPRAELAAAQCRATFPAS